MTTSAHVKNREAPFDAGLFVCELCSPATGQWYKADHFERDCLICHGNHAMWECER